MAAEEADAGAPSRESDRTHLGEVPCELWSLVPAGDIGTRC